MRRLALNLGGSIFLLFTISLSANAQEQDSHPQYKMLRAEEDYSYLRDDSVSKADFWDPIKFIPLNNGKSIYISIGGEIRFQYEYFNDEAWGEGPQDEYGFPLQRYMLHFDFRIEKYIRLFVQLKSGIELGRGAGPRVPDEDYLDLHQGFSDLIFPFNSSSKLILRLGRQELWYGSRRLVSVREGPNVRQTFDAARFIIDIPNLRIDGFISRPVNTKVGIFDDDWKKDVLFWGGYAVLTLGIGDLDFYYFGLDKKEAEFDAGIADEIRHSIGLRYWGSVSSFSFDLEFVYQWGKFGDVDIRAWTASVNLDYKINNLLFKPTIGIKTEHISGDTNISDNKLGTFNPLFPRGAYFGLIALIGPANLFDIHPSIKLELTKNLAFMIDYVLFWRFSANDGIYGPNGTFERTGQTSNQKFIGSQIDIELALEVDRHTSLGVELSYFTTGGFLKESGKADNVTHIVTTASYKF